MSFFTHWPETLPFLMFLFLLINILCGVPVAFALPSVALLFGLIGHGLELFFWDDFAFVPQRIFGLVQNVTLMAVPQFILMGLLLEKSGIASDMLRVMNALLIKVKGGLAMSVVLVGALLAASTGIVGATVVTMGTLTLPTMLKLGHCKQLSTGTIAASGTLGQIIPPSIVLVLLGDIMNVDVGDLFTGAIIPGAMLVLSYLLYIFFSFQKRPQVSSIGPGEESFDHPSKLLQAIVQSFLPPLALIFLVLGSILAGLASPTEASGCGALGAFLITWAKGRANWKEFNQVAVETVRLTSMVFTLLIGAQFFGVVFRGLEGDEVLRNLLLTSTLSPLALLITSLLFIFLLGFFLDFIEICFIVIPLITPILVNMGLNPLWLAILFAINLQTSFLTPPFGLALFYLKGVAPKEVSTQDIYRGVLPYVLLQILVLVLLILFPTLVTWHL